MDLKIIPISCPHFRAKSAASGLVRNNDVLRLADFHGRVVREAHHGNAAGKGADHSAEGFIPIKVNFLVLDFLFGERTLRNIVPAVLSNSYEG